MSKVILNILNVLYALFGAILLVLGIVYWIYIWMFTSLRNSNHFKLNFTVYWPQALPFIFGFAGIFIIFVSCCGCCSASKRSRGLTKIHGIFTVLTLIIVIAAAAIALIFADNKASQDFLEDTIWEDFSEAKLNPEVSAAFSKIETLLECCGVKGSTDYKLHSGREHLLPKSCCGYDVNSTLVCDSASKTANERHGCSAVVISYSGIGVKFLAASAALTAFIGVLSLIASLSLGLRKKRPGVYEATDIETKKGLL